MKLTIERFAESINEYCKKRDYFWACGLIKETVQLWTSRESRNLLCNEARMMAEHYVAELI